MAVITITTIPADVTLPDATDSTLVINAPNAGYPKDGAWVEDFVIEVLSGSIQFSKGKTVTADSSVVAAGDKPIFAKLRGNAPDSILHLKGGAADSFRIHG